VKEPGQEFAREISDQTKERPYDSRSFIWEELWGEIKKFYFFLKIATYIFVIVAAVLLPIYFYGDFAGHILNNETLKKHFAKDLSEHIRNIILMIIGAGGMGIALWRASLAGKQTRIERSGQIIEIHTRALGFIGQAGDENIFRRINGIHTLERVVKNDEEFLFDVLRTLASFVRNTTIKSKPDQPSSDIEEAISVLSNLTSKYKDSIAYDRWENVDLSRAYLSKSRFADKVCSGFIFKECDFSGSSLERIVLNVANFTGAGLQKVEFKQATGMGTSFKGADLSGANFLQGTSLKYAGFQHSMLTGAKFCEQPILTEANFDHAILQRAVINDAKCIVASFRSASLQEADISNSNFKKANFEAANLQNANISNSNFTKANFKNADMKGAVISGANFAGAKLMDPNLLVDTKYAKEHPPRNIPKHVKLPAPIPDGRNKGHSD